MTRSSGPVDAAVARWIRRHAPAGPVVLGVSGGADSLALALALRLTAGDRAVAVSVDHGLQDGSAEQAQRCAAQLRGIGFSAPVVVRVRVGGGGGPEAAARRARLDALREVAAALAPATPILLAHTLDDQAETVLLGLSRGSGPRSIAGMRDWRSPFGRPLLGVRRTETEARCRAAGLQFWTDPHNADRRYTRVRLRREVLPLLEDVLGGGVAAALARTADLLDADVRQLDEQAAALYRDLVQRQDGDTAWLPAASVEQLPTVLRRRILRSWLQDNGITGMTADHLERAEAMVDAASRAARVRLPGGVDLVRSDEELRLLQGPLPR